MAALRADLVFSYWIFVWFILYKLNVIPYNPKFVLIVGLFDNLIILILMFLFTLKIETIVLFIIINTAIKIIPLYYLKNETIKLKDIYFTILLFIFFIIWLHINKQSLKGNLKIIINSLLYNKGETPFINLINNIKKYYKNIEII